MEAGRRSVTADELKRLSHPYGVSTAWILGEYQVALSDQEDKLLLAARELSKIKEEDLERLIRAIEMVRSPKAKSE